MSSNPTKFTEAKREEYLRAISEDGLGRCAAATSVGVTRETVNQYVKSHPEFAEQRDEAELLANEQVENALFMAALSGNVTACQVWLYNRLPDRWKDQRRPDVGGEDRYAAVDIWVRAMKGEKPSDS